MMIVSISLIRLHQLAGSVSELRLLMCKSCVGDQGEVHIFSEKTPTEDFSMESMLSTGHHTEK